jgi:hypothetical protein
MDRRLVAPAGAEVAPPQEAPPPRGGHSALRAGGREAEEGAMQPGDAAKIIVHPRGACDTGRRQERRRAIRDPRAAAAGGARGSARPARTSARPSPLLRGATRGPDAAGRPLPAIRRASGQTPPLLQGTLTEILTQ